MKVFKRPALVEVDGDAALAEARKLIGRRIEAPARRAFLQRSLTLGGLSLLSGCSISDNASVEAALMRISRFNDAVQGWIFDPNQLAPTYPDSMITRPFPFNAYYGEDEVREVDEASYRLEVTGLVADKRNWTLGRPARHAAAGPGHAAHLRRRLERHRQVGRRAALPSSCAGSAPTRVRSTSASSVPTTTSPASTCPLRCIRRPCWR